MMEQRNQMLRELRLNKKESLGMVSFLFHIIFPNFHISAMILLFYFISNTFTLYLQTYKKRLFILTKLSLYRYY